MSRHRHPPEHDRPVAGMVCKIASVLVLSVMTALVKWLGPDFSTGEIVFFRSVFALPPIVFAALSTGGWVLLRPYRLTSHVLRSMAGASAMFLGFAAVALIPLADATALGFAAPLFIVLLAVLMLGEKVHAFRWTAVAAGFVGVLVMLWPHIGLGAASLRGATLALSGAALSALAMIFLRRMSAHEHSITIAFYFTVTTLGVGAVSALWGWTMPDGKQAIALVVIGLCGGVGQLLLSYSYRFGEASLIATFDYTAMIWAVTFGVLVFHEVPSIELWIGGTIVIGAGLAIAWREHRLRLRRRREAAALAPL